jgi:hypothetical protein
MLKREVSSKTTIQDFIAERVMSALVEFNLKGVQPNMPLPQMSADVFAFTTSIEKGH